MGGDTAGNRDGTTGLNLNLCALIGAKATHFDITGDPNAKERAAIVPLTALGLFAAQRSVVTNLQGFTQGTIILTAIVDQPGRCFVGKALGWDKVLAAHFGGIQAQLNSHQVDHTLDVVGGLGAACTAISSNWRGIGIDARRLKIDIWDMVDPHSHCRRQIWEARCEGVGPQIGDDPHPERGDRPIGLGRDLHVTDLTTSVGSGQHMLQAPLNPANRGIEASCEESTEEIFGVDPHLDPETTTHIRSDHADLALVQVHCLGELRANLVGSLGTGIDDQALGRAIRGGENSPPLHREPEEALVDQPLAHHGMGSGTCGFDITTLATTTMVDIIG